MLRKQLCHNMRGYEAGASSDQNTARLVLVSASTYRCTYSLHTIAVAVRVSRVTIGESVADHTVKIFVRALDSQMLKVGRGFDTLNRGADAEILVQFSLHNGSSAAKLPSDGTCDLA